MVDVRQILWIYFFFVLVSSYLFWTAHQWEWFLMLQEKIAILRENESLQKEYDRLKNEKQSLLKNKDLADGQVMALTKSLEALQNNIKEKEILVIFYN